MADPAVAVESTTTVSTPVVPTKLQSLQATAHPLSVLVLAVGGSLAVVIVAVGALLNRVESQTLLSILSTFFGFLGGVMGGIAIGRSMPARATDVTTTTTGPAGTTAPGGP